MHIWMIYVQTKEAAALKYAIWDGYIQVIEY